MNENEVGLFKARLESMRKAAATAMQAQARRSGEAAMVNLAAAMLQLCEPFIEPSTQQTGNTCYFQTYLFAVLCKVGRCSLGADEWLAFADDQHHAAARAMAATSATAMAAATAAVVPLPAARRVPTSNEAT